MRGSPSKQSRRNFVPDRAAPMMKMGLCDKGLAF
jgi:hypothetical protein